MFFDYVMANGFITFLNCFTFFYSFSPNLYYCFLNLSKFFWSSNFLSVLTITPYTDNGCQYNYYTIQRLSLHSNGYIFLNAKFACLILRKLFYWTWIRLQKVEHIYRALQTKFDNRFFQFTIQCFGPFDP